MRLLNLNNVKKLEILILYILIPIALALPEIAIRIKLGLAAIAVFYIVWISVQHRKNLFTPKQQVKPQGFWRRTIINLILIFIASYAYIQPLNPDLLFSSMMKHPWVWLQFLAIYTFISVVPQEYIYRIFFFYRYRKLINNPIGFYLLNAFVFCLAHLFFYNWFVLLFTFVGGYIFAYTYNKTKSWFWVSIEHAIYGGWLFTIGLGKILGFPI